MKELTLPGIEQEDIERELGNQQILIIQLKKQVRILAEENRRLKESQPGGKVTEIKKQ